MRFEVENFNWYQITYRVNTQVGWSQILVCDVVAEGADAGIDQIYARWGTTVAVEGCYLQGTAEAFYGLCKKAHEIDKAKAEQN